MPLELEGRLFRGEQDQRRASRIRAQGGGNFGEAAIGFSASGGSYNELDLHGWIGRSGSINPRMEPMVKWESKNGWVHLQVVVLGFGAGSGDLA